MSIGAAFSLFWAEFWGQIPVFGPRLLLAWLVTFFGLIYAFRWLKNHLRPVVLRIDENIRFWALGLRFRERGNAETERKFLSIFFRFWTNFASAPSLSILSLVLAVAFIASHGPTGRIFFLPGLCYAGSMLFSYVSKRVFKRLRPVREHGAFGHKLKDGSFPSGHSLTAFCFWIPVAACAFWLHLPPALDWSLVLIGPIITGLTGLSRIYLGVHWPTDVLGGFTIGFFWCLMCFLVIKPVL